MILNADTLAALKAIRHRDESTTEFLAARPRQLAKQASEAYADRHYLLELVDRMCSEIIGRRDSEEGSQ